MSFNLYAWLFSIIPLYFIKTMKKQANSLGISALSVRVPQIVVQYRSIISPFNCSLNHSKTSQHSLLVPVGLVWLKTKKLKVLDEDRFEQKDKACLANFLIFWSKFQKITKNHFIQFIRGIQIFNQITKFQFPKCNFDSKCD